ncbi:MAG: hypothetical protein R3B45_15235 [Bdellovibrionota bacterium]
MILQKSHLQSIKIATLLFLIFLSAYGDNSLYAQKNAISSRKYLDYSQLSHEIEIMSIRAGNQDDSGTNQYYFTTNFTARKQGENTKDKNSNEMTINGETFGSVELKSLDRWVANKKNGNLLQIKISGDKLRK